MTDALGSLVSSAYLAVKGLECDYSRDKPAEEEARLHFYKV